MNGKRIKNKLRTKQDNTFKNTPKINENDFIGF